MDFTAILTATAPNPPTMVAAVWDNHVALHVPSGHRITDGTRSHYEPHLHVVQSMIANLQATVPVPVLNQPRHVTHRDTLRSYYRLLFCAQYEREIGAYPPNLFWAKLVMEMPAQCNGGLLLDSMRVVTSYPIASEHIAL